MSVGLAMYLGTVRTLPCGHVAYAASARACPHLADPRYEGGRHVRLLTGRRLEYDLACAGCDASGQPVTLVQICEGCVQRHAEDAENGDLAAWRGQPGIEERPEPVDRAVTQWPLPDELHEVIDLAPFGTTSRSTWLILTVDGRVAEVEPDEQRYTVLAAVDLLAEAGHQPWMGRVLRHRLHASACGRFAAIVNDYGRFGRVVDLDRSGATTLLLDGGTHHPDTVPYSVTFAQHGGRPIVVHRTAWNRLDVSDPESGRLLTARTHEPPNPDERPPHALDYFHGRLHCSPKGCWLADDGWVWSPVGLPVVWDLDRWLRTNVWESEDGPSRHRLCQRAYHWDIPMCFMTDNLLAVSGIGFDDEAMLAGVRVFSAASGHEITAFAGPTGELFSDGHRLYPAEPGGLEIWDPVTGHRTGAVPGFVPTCHHRRAGELATAANGVMRRWRTGRDTAAPATS